MTTTPIIPIAELRAGLTVRIIETATGHATRPVKITRIEERVANGEEAPPRVYYNNPNGEECYADAGQCTFELVSDPDAIHKAASVRPLTDLQQLTGALSDARVEFIHKHGKPPRLVLLTLAADKMLTRGAHVEGHDYGEDGPRKRRVEGAVIEPMEGEGIAFEFVEPVEERPAYIPAFPPLNFGTQMARAVDVAMSECKYQFDKHGDDRHSVCEWLALLSHYAAKGLEAWNCDTVTRDHSPVETIRKIAGLALSALEQHPAPFRNQITPFATIAPNADSNKH